MPTPTVINQWRYSDAISRRYWDTQYFFDNFATAPVYSGITTPGAPTGTAGNLNSLITGNSEFQWNVIGTQTILAPTLDAFGLNLVQDVTASDGIELGTGNTSLNAFQYTIGTSAAFSLKGQFKVEDASGTGTLIIGFRKLDAFNATLANYTDFATIGIQGTLNPNKIQIQTQIATGGVTTTDTTQTAADASTTMFEVKVSSTGVVTYAINGAAPTVTAAYTFANGTIVVPFVRFVQAADLTTQASCNYLECGFQS